MIELIWDGKYDKDGKRVTPLRGKPKSTKMTNVAFLTGPGSSLRTIHPRLRQIGGR